MLLKLYFIAKQTTSNKLILVVLYSNYQNNKNNMASARARSMSKNKINNINGIKFFIVPARIQ